MSGAVAWKRKRSLFKDLLSAPFVAARSCDLLCAPGASNTEQFFTVMIFHAEKRSGFLMVSKEAINDPRLSLKAKGLLCYLLSKPPDWSPNPKEVAKHCNDGPASIRSAFRELREFGYAVLITPRDKSGRVSAKQWSIFEIPGSTEKPENRKVSFRQDTNNRSTNNKDLDLREVEDPFYDKFPMEQKRQEALTVVEKCLSDLKGTKFWDVWMTRIEHCPIRVMSAVATVEEYQAMADYIKRKGGRLQRRDIIRNPGGRADYDFRNIDIKTGKTPDYNAR